MLFRARTPIMWKIKVKDYVKLEQTEVLGKFFMKEESAGIVLGNNWLSLDIDDRPREEAERLLKRFAEQEQLGNCVFVKTSERHWQGQFFWNILPPKKVLQLIDKCSFVDEDFKKLRKQYGSNRLRIGPKGNKPKPEIIKIIKSKHHQDNPFGQMKYKIYRVSLKGGPQR